MIDFSIDFHDWYVSKIRLDYPNIYIYFNFTGKQEKYIKLSNVSAVECAITNPQAVVFEITALRITEKNYRPIVNKFDSKLNIKEALIGDYYVSIDFSVGMGFKCLCNKYEIR